jgi:hypothetical protein
MKEKTILSFIETLKSIRKSKMSIASYCKENGLSCQSIYDKMHEFKRTTDQSNSSYNEVVELYNSIVTNGERSYEKVSKAKDVCEVSTEEIESSNFTEVKYERDNDGKIVYYDYKIYRKNKTPLIGKLSRDEMNIIYRLYSYYGASLTQREVSRYFNELSLVDFKRILSAFNIYKASAPFAPHVIEETPVDELRNMQLREKENDFLKKIEEDRIRNNEKLLKKYAVENSNLKNQLNTISNTKFKIEGLPLFIKPNSNITASKKILNLYLADMHIGAIVTSGTLYNENKDYGYDVCLARLNNLIIDLTKLGDKYDCINVCLMGDMMDCCGPTNQTARMDHYMPENMDGFEQANSYIKLIYGFAQELANTKLTNNIKFYSVRCGNHTGAIEYVATRALFAELSIQGFECTLFNDFFGVMNVGKHFFVLTHGKDDRFMKKGMPLNLDDKNKVRIMEWLEDKGIHGKNIHIIKGDLHSSAYSACKGFDYRNVLSLFGASDYCAFNFGRNDWGCSYDIIQDDNILRGEFTNL